MVKHGIKEILELLDMIDRGLHLGIALSDGVDLSDWGELVRFAKTIQPAIKDIEMIWLNELKDLDSEELEVIKNRVLEIFGGLITVPEEWLKVAQQQILAVIGFIKLIQLRKG